MMPAMLTATFRSERTMPLESGRSLVNIMDWQTMALVKSKTPQRIAEIRKNPPPTFLLKRRTTMNKVNALSKD